MKASRASTRQSCVIWTSSSAPARMCRIVMLVTLFSMNIHASSQIPPRLHACRDIIKAKEQGQTHTFIVQETCDGGHTVTFPMIEPLNLTDHRNCENFFTCKGNSCNHCPCDPGETFNPVTKQCDATNSVCECPEETITPPSTTLLVVPPETEKSTIQTTKKTLILVQNAGSDSQNEDNSEGSAQKPVSSEVIIIAAIVSATVIVIVVIVMAVFCWQRRQKNQNVRMSKPSATKLSLSAVSHDGYSTSMPPSEKHVYAEIDEQMINGRKHWQHGGSLRAPPLPNHQPPLHPQSHIGTCPHQHAHNRTDSGLGSADTSFNSNYPKRTFQPINPAHSIKIGISYNERQSDGQQCCGEEMYHCHEDSSASSDSQYSHSSNPPSIDSHDIDMRTPLHGIQAKQNWVSKQVYI